MKTTIRTMASLAAAATALLAVAGANAQDRDRNGPFADGVLTAAEFQALADERFDRADANRDGYVSRSEADEARADARARVAERREGRDGDARRSRFADGGRRGERGDDREGAFARRDADDDGFVSRADARDAALAAFDRADANGDGEVTRDEMRGGKRRGGRR